jgi:uncharacterized membrane protein YkvA (DUF1232 family)
MTELQARCLDAFPNWLRSLGSDARALTVVLENTELDLELRKGTASALNYLFRSLDLIPDGIEDLGYIDDAFVLRAALAATTRDKPELEQADASDTVRRLASECSLVAEFLGDDFERLQSYVAGLDKTTARGRSVDDILQDANVRSDFLREVRSWADSYSSPTFARDQKNLVKLKAFLSAKLP